MINGLLWGELFIVGMKGKQKRGAVHPSSSKEEWYCINKRFQKYYSDYRYKNYYYP